MPHDRFAVERAQQQVPSDLADLGPVHPDGREGWLEVARQLRVVEPGDRDVAGDVEARAEGVEEGRVEPEDALAQSLRPSELAQALRGRT